MDWAETPATLARARAEQAVAFAGPEGRIAAIFTPAAPEAPLANRCVIFPARPRFGTRRLAVLGSRTLAAEGFACLRFDLHGHGESAGTTMSPDRNQPYGGEVEAAIRYLREAHAQHRFLLVGYCFDALSALDAFRNEAEAIDGLFFAAAPVLVEPLADSKSISGRIGNRRRMPHLSRRSLWNRLRLISAVVQGLRCVEKQAEIANLTRRAQISRGVEIPLAALARSRARALFLYGEHEPFYEEFKFVECRLFANLDGEARRRLRIELWPNAVHAIESEPAILDRVVSWVREFQPLLGNEPRHLESRAVEEGTIFRFSD